jgi:hypothetical protein
MVEVHGDRALANVMAACPEPVFSCSRNREKLVLVRVEPMGQGRVGPTGASAWLGEGRS